MADMIKQLEAIGMRIGKARNVLTVSYGDSHKVRFEIRDRGDGMALYRPGKETIYYMVGDILRHKEAIEEKFGTPTVNTMGGNTITYGLEDGSFAKVSMNIAYRREPKLALRRGPAIRNQSMVLAGKENPKIFPGAENWYNKGVNFVVQEGRNPGKSIKECIMDGDDKGVKEIMERLFEFHQRRTPTLLNYRANPILENHARDATSDVWKTDTNLSNSAYDYLCQLLVNSDLYAPHLLGGNCISTCLAVLGEDDEELYSRLSSFLDKVKPGIGEVGITLGGIMDDSALSAIGGDGTLATRTKGYAAGSPGNDGGRINEWIVHMGGREGYDGIMDYGRKLIDLIYRNLGEEAALHTIIFPTGVKAAELRNRTRMLDKKDDKSLQKRARKVVELNNALDLVDYYHNL